MLTAQDKDALFESAFRQNDQDLERLTAFVNQATDAELVATNNQEQTLLEVILRQVEYDMRFVSLFVFAAAERQHDNHLQLLEMYVAQDDADLDLQNDDNLSLLEVIMSQETINSRFAHLLIDAGANIESSLLIENSGYEELSLIHIAYLFAPEVDGVKDFSVFDKLLAHADCDITATINEDFSGANNHFHFKHAAGGDGRPYDDGFALENASLLHLAAIAGDAEMIQTLWATGQFDLNQTCALVHNKHVISDNYNNFENALITADGDLNTIDGFLTQVWYARDGVTVRRISAITPLHLAAFAGHTSTMDRLQERGATNGLEDTDGKKPVDYAEELQHLAELSLRQSADYLEDGKPMPHTNLGNNFAAKHDLEEVDQLSEMLRVTAHISEQATPQAAGPKETQPASAPPPPAMHAAMAGLAFQKIPGDGHCLFHAVGLYLGQDQAFLRNITASHMAHNHDHFVNYLGGDEERFERHVDAIRAGAEWGGALEIEAIQRATGRPIIIIRSDTNPNIPDNIAEYNTPPIFVYYNGIDHYDAFITEGDADPNTILGNIQEAMQAGSQVTYKRAAQDNAPSYDKSPHSRSERATQRAGTQTKNQAAVEGLVLKDEIVEWWKKCCNYFMQISSQGRKITQWNDKDKECANRMKKAVLTVIDLILDKEPKKNPAKNASGGDDSLTSSISTTQYCIGKKYTKASKESGLT